jgi:hypothetical protein
MDRSRLTRVNFKEEFMTKGLLLALFTVLVIQTPTHACDIHGRSGIVEDNDLWISVDQKENTNGMDEATFNAVLDRIEAIYTPVIRSRGKTLRVDRDWSNGTVNAFAQQTGNIWRISMFGGLARHHTVTPDGFALVACHEIGHHIGGLPKKRGFFGSSWASNEGQSDYFGNAKCLRIYFEEDDNIAIVEQMDVPEYATERCEANFTTAEDVAICQRGAMAGMSLANLFRALRNSEDELKFDTPDPRQVARTDDNHPASQCRLDTYFQGALCEISAYEDLSDRDVNEGACHPAAGHTDGLRPLCWYAP